MIPCIDNRYIQELAGQESNIKHIINHNEPLSESDLFDEFNTVVHVY